MASSATSIFVLTAVLTFEPVNGYQVCRELQQWGVGDWAHLKPGSIYSMLHTLTKRGHLQRHDLRDGHRTVAVYTSTTSGHAEFDRLIQGALTTVDPMGQLSFSAALTPTRLIKRSTYVECLRQRQGDLDKYVAGLDEKTQAVHETRYAPPEVGVLLGLQRDTAVAESEWLERYLDRIETGEFTFYGEGDDWSPPSDDPGWQMHAERQRYLAMLNRDN